MNEEPLFWLAVNTYHEARGEPFDGQVAVCHVVLNRAFERRLYISEVVLQRKQFSWANGRRRPPIEDYRAFIVALEAANECRRERDEEGHFLFGANHYYATTMKKPPKWAKYMTEVAVIGNHRFMRDR